MTYSIETYNLYEATFADADWNEIEQRYIEAKTIAGAAETAQAWLESNDDETIKTGCVDKIVLKARDADQHDGDLEFVTENGWIIM